jgi:predicted transcriptional regulator
MALRLRELVDLLDGDIVVGHEKTDLSFEFCTASDLMSDVLRGPTSGSVLITGLNNTQVIRASIIANVAAIVLVRKKDPGEEVVRQAREHGIPLIRTPLTMFTSCGRLFQAGLQGVDGLLSPE